MSEKMRKKALMQKSGVKFGTSGARGLAAMTDGVCRLYNRFFILPRRNRELESKNASVAIAGDLIEHGVIMSAVAQAVRDKG